MIMQLADTVRPFDREVPHALDAERCVLGSMMLAGTDPAAFHEISGKVARDAFFLTDHQIIFAALCETMDAKGCCDIVMLRDELNRRQLLADVGGVGYLAELSGAAPSYVH